MCSRFQSAPRGDESASPKREVGPSRGSIPLPAPHERARERVVPSQGTTRFESYKGVGTPRTVRSSIRTTDRPLLFGESCKRVAETGDRGRKGAIPRATSSRRTEGTCRSITRISSFAGRVTEAALHRKVKPGAERVGLWPAVTRMTCSDVLRVRRGDRRCPWRQQAGAHGGSMLSRKRSCRTRILDSLAPNRRDVTCSARSGERRVARKPPYPATDRRWVHPRRR